MSIDFNKPVKTDNYDTGLLSSIRAHIVAVACMLEPSDVGTVSNPPTGTRRFNAGTGVFERYNGSSWVEQSTGYLKATTAASTYAPLTGAGTSGTWGISVTGSAGSVAWANVTGKPALVNETAATAATANTLAKRDASGDLFGRYLSQSSSLEAPAIGAVFVENAAGDGYHRKISLANFNAQIAPAWANVTGKPTAVSAWTNDAGYLTSSALTGYAQLATAPVFTGQVKGNSGTKGLGAITVTTTTGTPSGGADGDFVLVY